MKNKVTKHKEDQLYDFPYRYFLNMSTVTDLTFACVFAHFITIFKWRIYLKFRRNIV